MPAATRRTGAFRSQAGARSLQETPKKCQRTAPNPQPFHTCGANPPEPIHNTPLQEGKGTDHGMPQWRLLCKEQEGGAAAITSVWKAMQQHQTHILGQESAESLALWVAQCIDQGSLAKPRRPELLKHLAMPRQHGKGPWGSGSAAGSLPPKAQGPPDNLESSVAVAKVQLKLAPQSNVEELRKASTTAHLIKRMASELLCCAADLSKKSFLLPQSIANYVFAPTRLLRSLLRDLTPLSLAL